MATGRQFDLPYMVEQWDDTDSHIEELTREAAETFAAFLPLASRSTILHKAAICGASFVRKFFPV